ncbi:hypothetical protein [Streptomyces boncukensis]|uniref:Uncharacterized protein n=1 Tax=Streptomyces boncukensis TaxID=2711219 RepID=A0A6G4X6X0_9ACTN|nr:hypothetical protein [Streptomyces boncukensis]NGO73265.1 hypothetical protein [Streptomyces boncukensis]
MAARDQPVSDCWMVALPGTDGKSYVYRVYAPRDALPGDLFWSAFHCHDASRLPRAHDCFDAAEIWLLPVRDTASRD